MPLDTSCPSPELVRRSFDPDDPMTDSERLCKIRVDPVLDLLLSDPRFDTLIHRLNMTFRELTE